MQVCCYILLDPGDSGPIPLIDLVGYDSMKEGHFGILIDLEVLHWFKAP
jgi:hypothetical protein